MTLTGAEVVIARASTMGNAPVAALLRWNQDTEGVHPLHFSALSAVDGCSAAAFPTMVDFRAAMSGWALRFPTMVDFRAAMSEWALRFPTTVDFRAAMSEWALRFPTTVDFRAAMSEWALRFPTTVDFRAAMSG